MAAFRYGFKSWCEKMAAGLRRDLGLDPNGPLNPYLLAEHLSVKVICPNELTSFPDKLRNLLLVDDSQSWSAVTLTLPTGTIVIRNSSSALVRQNNDIMHELAHIILQHKAAEVMLSPNGHMFLDQYDKNQELEADWLAAALLIPRDPLLEFYTGSGGNLSATAQHFGVSTQLVTMRLDKTGINRQLQYRTEAQESA